METEERLKLQNLPNKPRTTCDEGVKVVPRKNNHDLKLLQLVQKT